MTTTTTASATTTSTVNPFAADAIETTLLPAKALAMASLVLCVLANWVVGKFPCGALAASLALLAGGSGPLRFRDARMVYYRMYEWSYSFMYARAVWRWLR